MIKQEQIIKIINKNNDKRYAKVASPITNNLKLLYMDIEGKTKYPKDGLMLFYFFYLKHKYKQQFAVRIVWNIIENAN